MAIFQFLLTRGFIMSSALSTPVGHLPVYKIIPNALSEDDTKTLEKIIQTETGQKQWYGRTTYWTEIFSAKVGNAGQITIEHTKNHFGNTAIDNLTTLFLKTIGSFVDLKNRTVGLQIYLDRNEVAKQNSATSGMLWHRDRVTTNAKSDSADCPARFGDYSVVYLMSPENQWKGGNMLLQHGGEAISRREWKNSQEPVVTIQPKCNQAIIFKNSDSAHCVDPIEPINETVQRDVVVITAVLET